MDNKERKAVYAGSFDPPTNGHIWMIEQGAKMFDKLIVAIGVNPDKKYTFSVEERLQMLQNSIKDSSNVNFDEFIYDLEGKDIQAPLSPPAVQQRYRLRP